MADSPRASLELGKRESFLAAGERSRLVGHEGVAGGAVRAHPQGGRATAGVVEHGARRRGAGVVGENVGGLRAQPRRVVDGTDAHAVGVDADVDVVRRDLGR